MVVPSDDRVVELVSKSYAIHGKLVNPNPTFEWVRLAQRIPVRIHIDDVPEGVLVSSGMTCAIVVDAPARRWAILAALQWAEEAIHAL